MSDLWASYYNFDFEYDDKANPLYKFRASKWLPARLSPNNVTKISMIQSADVGGPPSQTYTAEINIAYEYNDEGLPVSATRTYSCQGSSDAIVNQYDRVP